MKKLAGIDVIIWDFDGTFYPLRPEISKAMEIEQYRTIMRYKSWGMDRAKREFWKIYPKKTTSGNAAVGMICAIPTARAAVENELHFDRLKFLTRDPKLVPLFESLKGFRHFILGNGVKKKLAVAAHGIGIPEGVIEEIVTSEVSGANKPDAAGFRYILKKTGLPPASHLMVGDREIVDLAPAKKVGMRTCLVAWGEGFIELPRPGKNIDITIPEVYDLPKVV